MKKFQVMEYNSGKLIGNQWTTRKAAEEQLEAIKREKREGYFMVKELDERPTLEKLNQFVNSRPGLDFADYGDSKAYNAESREITKDRGDYYELLGFASWRVQNLEEKLTAKLLNSPERLSMNGAGEIVYTAGQYHPTEYRPAAARAIATLIWNDYRDERDPKGEPVYKDGNEMRKAIRRNVSRRVARFYFN